VPCARALHQRYDAWLEREPSERAKRDEEPRERIETIFEENRRVYGRPRIHAEPLEQGERVGGKRVGRLMGELGIRGASRRRRKPGTTTHLQLQDVAGRASQNAPAWSCSGSP
jgi:putative transposase